MSLVRSTKSFMPAIRTIFFCGHESRYGRAHLQALLLSNVFRVEEVVLASVERWGRFQSALTGESFNESLRNRLAFQRRARLIKKQILEIKRIPVRFVSEVNSEAEVLNATNYDLAICAAYPQIFKTPLLQAPRHGAINFHPSLLPRCRGAHPTYWTIASQEPQGGVSCHIMTEQLDAGAIVAQRRLEFDKAAVTYEQLYQMVEAETPLLCRDVEEFYSERKSPIPQTGMPSYFRNEREIDRKICFGRENLQQVSAKIRAGRAFVFDRFGRRVHVDPPVLIVATPSYMTSRVQESLPDGTVVEIPGNQAVITIGNQFLMVNYHIADGGSWDAMLRKSRKFFGLPPRALSIGEILR